MNDVQTDQQQTDTTPTLAFVWQRELGQRPAGWKHGPRPAQLLRTHHLVEDVGAFGWKDVERISPEPIDDDVLLQFHTESYVQTVQAISAGGVSLLDSEAYGLHESQLKRFPAMHEYYRSHVAAALAAGRCVADGRVQRAFTPAGGFHLAQPAQARKLCIYNDVVLLLSSLVARGLRVAYVDLGVHHCDAVQTAFADSDAVLAISLHEGPEFLFPGSGFANEIDSGYSVNAPLPPGAGDEHVVWVTENLIEPLLEQYDADVLVTQLGLGMHTCNPVAHLNVTTHGYVAVLERLHRYAKRWVAVGGAGADLDVAARAWTLAFATMADRVDTLPEDLPDSYTVHWDGTTLHDEELVSLPAEHNRYIWSYIRMRVNEAQRALYPLHGLPAPDKIEFISLAPQAMQPVAEEQAKSKRPGIEMPKSVVEALAEEKQNGTGDDSSQQRKQSRDRGKKRGGRGRGKRGRRNRGKK